MLRNILFTTLLLAMVGVLKAQTALDSALAGEWVLEKMVVSVQQHQNQAMVKEYTLTELPEMYRLSEHVISSIRFEDRKFQMAGAKGHMRGSYTESGTGEIGLLPVTLPSHAEQEPPGMTRIGWARKGDRLHLVLPVSIYRDSSVGGLVDARYVCHFVRKK